MQRFAYIIVELVVMLILCNRGLLQVQVEGLETQPVVPKIVLGPEAKQTLQSICEKAAFPDTCMNELSPLIVVQTPLRVHPNNMEDGAEQQPQQISAQYVVGLLAEAAQSKAAEALQLAARFSGARHMQALARESAADCVELMDLTHHYLQKVVDLLARLEMEGPSTSHRMFRGIIADVKLHLSSCLGYQSACYDGLIQAVNTGAYRSAGQGRQEFQGNQEYLFEVIGNVLSLAQQLQRQYPQAVYASSADQLHEHAVSLHGSRMNDDNRMLLNGPSTPLSSGNDDDDPMLLQHAKLYSRFQTDSELPYWLSPTDYQLLLQSPAASEIRDVSDNTQPPNADPSDYDTPSPPLAPSAPPLTQEAQPASAPTAQPPITSINAQPPSTNALPPAPTALPPSLTALPPSPNSQPPPLNPQQSLGSAVVAQDGSGDFKTITEALQAIPTNFTGRFIMYIKAGVYQEVFNISREMENVSLLGDGMDRTIITASNNVAILNFTTFRSSTVGISGDGFFARDITFRNTAGARAHQAVALRASADRLVFYRCRFEGFQDTLYAVSGRQFYRDCEIAGTVDMIFGYAIAVFQNCKLLARRPMKGQQNTFTAQGRKLESDINGFVFQNCTVAAKDGLRRAPFPVSNYLGRPWKEFSRVVFLQSELDGVVHPQGWLHWNQSDPFVTTVFYGEYRNRGAGSVIDGRVSWPGVHANLTFDEADAFTLGRFLEGDSWISSVLNPISFFSSLL